MHRNQIISLLNSYLTLYPKELDLVNSFKDFINTYDDCFERTQALGHLTASACLLNSNLDSMFLLYHKKLKKWLQPGGHADGNTDLFSVALTEVHEETGLCDLNPLMQGIFDLDIHQIPAFNGQSAHLHYDCRFLLNTSLDKFMANNESIDAAWVKLDEVSKLTSEESILRMIRKTKAFLNR
ncbi:MAG: NUDIX hydrolase [Bdellovibrionales bacterium]|nr:NUDIX hydrolase [Bdellovibrionales bacterium]